MSTNEHSAIIRTLLAQGMSGVAKANELGAQVQEARGGAYTLFVRAASMSEDLAEFVGVTDALFAEIRVSATVTDAAGTAYPVGAKPGKDGNGFVIPNSFSAAKSVIVDALTRSVPLLDKDGERSFTAIRKDVKALRDAEERAKATGDDRIRLDVLEMLAMLTEKAHEAKGADLAHLYHAVKRAAQPPKAKASAVVEAQAEVLAAAA